MEVTFNKFLEIISFYCSIVIVIAVFPILVLGCKQAITQKFKTSNFHVLPYSRVNYKINIKELSTKGHISLFSLKTKISIWQLYFGIQTENGVRNEFWH